MRLAFTYLPFLVWIVMYSGEVGSLYLFSFELLPVLTSGVCLMRGISLLLTWICRAACLQPFFILSTSLTLCL